MSIKSSSHWIPLSDLMTGMMLIFMLVSIVYMVRIQQVATDLRDTKGKIYTALDKEFSKDFKKWDAEILSDLTIRFKNPETLFENGKDKVNSQYIEILNDFIPRYLKIIRSSEFKSSIKEIQIEGHTTQQFQGELLYEVKKIKTSEKARQHLENVGLSSDRAASVLEEILVIVKDTDNEDYVISNFRTHEVAGTVPILNDDGSVNEAKSRRVEFKIIANADDRLEEIAAQLSRKKE
jgi:outer membrane protein OmpA-like peptidoglycan-associated protein